MWLNNYSLALKIQTLSRMTDLSTGLDVINLIRPWEKSIKKRLNLGEHNCKFWNMGMLDLERGNKNQRAL